MRGWFLYFMMFLLAFTGAVQAGDLSEKEVKAAQKIYVGKCAKCHKLHDPTNYNDAEWQSWMTKMKRKARLKTDQAELLSRYLELIRAKGKAPTDKIAP